MFPLQRVERPETSGLGWIRSTLMSHHGVSGGSPAALTLAAAIGRWLLTSQRRGPLGFALDGDPWRCPAFRGIWRRGFLRPL